MTKIEPLNNDREAFQLLLDVYGADRARWPAADRLRFAQLLSKDPLARKMLGEADAGFFFKPPDHLPKEFPQFPVTQTYGELQQRFAKAGNL